MMCFLAGCLWRTARKRLEGTEFMAQKRLSIEARRLQLADAALAVAEREGPAAVTARAVAAEAGVSLGLVHYCFATTQELAVLMAERAIEQFAEAALAAVDPLEAATDVRAVLDVGIKALWAEIQATRARRLLDFEMTAYAARTPGLEAVGSKQYRVSDLAAIRFLEVAAESAGASWSVDVAELARLIVMAVDGATFRWLADRDSDAALTSLAHVRDLIAGLAIPGEPKPAGPAAKRSARGDDVTGLTSRASTAS
jgi:AcrR family transcriptional regulator